MLPIFGDPSDRNERGRSRCSIPLTSYLRQNYMSSNIDFHHKAGARELYLRVKIFLCLGGLAAFALLGAGGARAGEAKPPSTLDWEKSVDAAKKEGKVIVSIPAGAELRKGIEKVFKQRFGVEAELNVGRAASIVAKIQQESRSGVAGFDVHMGGSESMVTGLLSQGILTPLEPAMDLRVIKDPSNWWDGSTWVAIAHQVSHSL